MIIELPNWVDLETTALIKERVRPFLQNKQDNYQTYRDGSTVNISMTEELKDIDEILHKIFYDLNMNLIARRYKIEHQAADRGYEYHRYGENEYCHYHYDGEVNDGLIRYASVVLHLSTNDEGGEIVFPNQQKTIKTEEGKVVIFPPYGMFGHYTNPSPTPREVIVTWFHYGNLRVGQV